MRIAFKQFHRVIIGKNTSYNRRSLDGCLLGIKVGMQLRMNTVSQCMNNCKIEICFSVELSYECRLLQHQHIYCLRLFSNEIGRVDLVESIKIRENHPRLTLASDANEYVNE